MYDFFAFINRMKYIERWGLMRNIVSDNLQEHCFQTAMLAHALCFIDCKYFGGKLVPERAALYALYHDAAEIITGDMPSPVKYYNSSIRGTYREIEENAQNQIIGMLPEDFREEYGRIINYENEDAQYIPIVKAADKLTAYLKCVEEERCGNVDFSSARKSLEKIINDMDMPCVKYFMDNFAGSYDKPLDELGRN
ncbi:MAG: 5'-deoxynucleotidase [Clostridia bacterium]|nr:5'-deoxynucleotidase [Clostridia bacterium]